MKRLPEKRLTSLPLSGSLWLWRYSELTKIRTRRRAADSTHVTARRGNAVLV
ncbi:hypothetical protein EIKCOROL_01708 [Eikenella corrodens ATCC 23834]|uniref:Uncharacterized protein n=1 Tax=Eikenella corrodens ATCC 23834 TaxID=546274 RepID=C0DWF7_EIKCO|nr:hypothetical protein EIKCOROL_01708 [Eikenella corrodens ATCC 23834]